MRRMKIVIALCLTTILALGLIACGKKKSDDEKASATDATPVDATTEEATTEETTAATTEAGPQENQVEDEDVPQYEGYNLLWHDEFNGTELNDVNWSYDPHKPGWTNAELQEYTESTDNVFIKDGALILKAIKTVDDSGKDYYTSGKVKSVRKQDFTYGKVCVRAKVPAGQGLWPAIWMMPTKESKYGTWPRCGEIDIMEILGNQPEITYGTIHYGEPHAEQQGSYILEGETFADDFHEFSVEWEPGELRFYVDGNLFHTCNDWFTAAKGDAEKPYPAPFDQDFYVQLNLAVGGTWPGNPDETTDFSKAEFVIDYVRVYQKPEYDTNVTRPEKVFREPTADGNLVWNGDFSEKESVGDSENWSFGLFAGGSGEAEIGDGEIIITGTKAGTETHSLQLVQADLPLYQGHKYKVTFDACADEDRTMIVCVSAPNANWARYLEDTKVDLKKDYQSFEYEFEMVEKDDNNGRIEFNMGSQKSTATIRIKNVRVVDITN